MTGPTGGRGSSWQRDPRAGWLALTMASAVLFVLVVVALLFSPALDHVDAAVSEAIRSIGGGTEAMVSVARAISFMGSTAFVMLACAVVGAWMLAKRRLDAVLYLLCAVPIGWLVSRGLKELFDRARPEGISRIPLPGDPSMPSGHTVASALMCAAIAVIVVLNVESPTAKKWAIGIGFVVSVLVGLSRVYLGVHWFGDVLAGWLFAAAWWGFTTSVYLGVVARRQAVPV